MVWKQGSDRTSLLSLIVIDRETEPSPAHHSSECKHLVDILCKQHSLLKRSSFSVNTDLCNLAQHCSVRFKPQEQANEVVCSWCEGGSVTYKVPLRQGSGSLKAPSARACRETRNHTEALRGGTQVLGGGHMRAAQTPAHLSPCGTGQQVVTDSRVTWAPGRQVHCPGPRTAVLQKHHMLAPHPPGTGHPVSSRAISSTWMQERGWRHTEAPPRTVLPRQGPWPRS